MREKYNDKMLKAVREGDSDKALELWAKNAQKMAFLSKEPYILLIPEHHLISFATIPCTYAYKVDGGIICLYHALNWLTQEIEVYTIPDGLSDKIKLNLEKDDTFFSQSEEMRKNEHESR